MTAVLRASLHFTFPFGNTSRGVRSGILAQGCALPRPFDTQACTRITRPTFIFQLHIAGKRWQKCRLLREHPGKTSEHLFWIRSTSDAPSTEQKTGRKNVTLRHASCVSPSGALPQSTSIRLRPAALYNTPSGTPSITTPGQQQKPPPAGTQTLPHQTPTPLPQKCVPMARFAKAECRMTTDKHTKAHG